MKFPLYIPLHLRLTLFYTLVLGLALLIFGSIVYTQAQQRAYRDLDNALSSRAASVRLGKFLACGTGNTTTTALPVTLPSVDGLGTGGIAIEVLDEQFHLIATTTGTSNADDPLQPGVAGLVASPVPWDARAARMALNNYRADGNESGLYSTITFQGQHVRVYSIASNFCSLRVIQTAQSQQAIEQSLNTLRFILISGGLLVLILTFAGGWLITWGVLAAVRRVTSTAQAISASHDFSQRVPTKSLAGRDELETLAATFNTMLANLQAVYQRQQRFVADASHELRAPITSIRCNLDLLAKAPDLPPAEAQAALNDARAEADRMGRLVNDLLSLARADANQHSASDDKQKIQRQQAIVDLDSLLLDVFRQYRRSGEGEDDEKHMPGPRFMLQHIAPAQVYGDSDQLKQAFVALLDNAFKYTPYEGSVALSLVTDDVSATVRISDTGIGILPEDLPHIFERFYRADPARSRHRGGTGLGLAIVYTIIQEHHGSIDVESIPGKGSTFIVKLPLAGGAD